MEKPKTFYNVAELTQEFQNQGRHVDNAASALLWQARIQLAIAQQLTVISGHLEDLIAAIHRSEGRKK